MKQGYGPSSHGPFEPALADQGLANRHVPGLSDEIGDRVLILDNRGTPTLELLRFARSLTTAAGFEVSLRRRAERLRQFRHPVFTATSSVECLGEDRRLVLLSSYTPGRRLSEVLEDAHGPAFASSLIRQLTPALAMLHQYDDGIGHGALTASRIVIPAEGPLLVVEHVLGSALERLQLTPLQMHRDLGIPVPATTGTSRVRMDSRTDLFQLGLIALSLLLGRPVNSDEYPEHLNGALEQGLSSLDGESAEEFHWLREWLERALQINGWTFPSAGYANDALRDVPDRAADPGGQRWQALSGIRRASADHWVELDVELDQAPHEELLELGAIAGAASVTSPVNEATPPPVDGRLDDPAPGSSIELIEASEASLTMPAVTAGLDETPPPTPAVITELNEASLPTPASTTEPKEASLLKPAGTTELNEAPLPTHVTASVEPPRIRPPKTVKAFRSDASFLKWAVVALALCAIAEAVAIAILLQRRSSAPAAMNIAEVNLETPDPGAAVMVDGRAAGVTPLQLKIGPDMRSISVVSPRPPAAKHELMVGSTGQQNSPLGSAADQDAGAGLRPGITAPSGPVPQRFGGIRLSSPIELEVFEGDRRLGSSATGIVSAPAGRHELDLVNSVLGFRSRRLVDIKGGQVVSMAVVPPNGRISINALPWAEVLIDGKLVGETPIGNLSIPLGEHEIIFRHPQLGELRRTALVRSDAVTRVSANLER